MPKARIEIWIGREDWSDVVGENPLVAETQEKEYREGCLTLEIKTSISERIANIPGGADLLRSHTQIGGVELLNQSSQRWYGGARLWVKIDNPDATFEQAVRTATDIIAGVFNGKITIDK